MSDPAFLRAAILAQQARVRLDDRHCYWVDGRRVPGVSSIRKVLDAPQLDEWKVRVQVEGTARAALANPRLDHEPEGEYVARLVRIAQREYEHQRISDEAASIGTQVHKLIEHETRLMLGEPTERPEVSEDAEFTFAGWREWAEASDYQPIVAEARVYHQQLRYAGTIDVLAMVRGRLTLLDAKPSATIYPDRRLQLAGYAMALESFSLDWPETDRAILSMPRDGGPIELVYLDGDEQADREAFAACLALYRWLRDLRKAKKAAA